MPAASSASGLTAIVTGNGPGVVLVHGSLGDYRQWEPIGEQLQRGFRVIALSRRYHWPNPPPSRDATYTYESQRDDLLNYLRGIGGPVHLVGHSYGAGIVLLAALAEPALVDRLILIEPSFGSLLPDTAPALQEEIASRNRLISEIGTRVQAGDDAGASIALIDWVQGGRGGCERLPEPIRAALLENAATIGPTFGSAPPHVSCDQLRQLNVPTLIVNGERTRPYYRLIGETAASCLGDAQAAQIREAGHMTIVERPAAVAAVIQSFLTHRS
jgi:pimeloyl-ACP methyl ester carboxylesterase